jgi:hypothetical protein
MWGVMMNFIISIYCAWVGHLSLEAPNFWDTKSFHYKVFIRGSLISIQPFGALA